MLMLLCYLINLHIQQNSYRQLWIYLCRTFYPLYCHKPKQTSNTARTVLTDTFLAFLQQIAHRAKLGETGR